MIKIIILTMWLHGPYAPLVIGAYWDLAQCEAVRPQYDTEYSWALCQSLEVQSGNVSRETQVQHEI